ncbi:hypothetical protein [Nocardioides sp. W7]|uniref:hypothetical protein n=1 Tax=Nocardioides sp. W7 TaxID=2931390 RepID=UPI001FD46666|nr:hypothetical protein [Nocardioides sp. W7]
MAAFLRDWGTADADDPRVLQAAFTLLVAIDLTFRMRGGARYDLVSWPVFAAVLLVLVTTVTMVVPWDRVPRETIAVLAVLDIVVVGTCRLSPEGSAWPSWSCCPPSGSAASARCAAR